MAFSKRFPKDVEGSTYPRWEEIVLNDEEESKIEKEARAENIALMKECLGDAKEIASEKRLPDLEITAIAISLFEKRASHSVYWKEKRSKEKFDKSK